MSPRFYRFTQRIARPTAASALTIGACVTLASCNLVLGLDAYYDCPEDPRCPPPDAGTTGTGGSAPACSTPAECPGGDDCTSPICSGGQCGLAAKPDGTACKADVGAGFRCNAGACDCPAENTCGDACVDLQIDPANCGACDNACPAEIACEAGQCACPNGGIVCAGACVDAQTDTANCGDCGKACTAAGATCDAGTCKCPGGGTDCSGTCVDTSTDLANCGTCGKACTASGSTCEAGTCKCPGGGTECSGACVDTSTDLANCGMCGNTCANGASCSTGNCTCPGSESVCAGSCVDTDIDAMNCGTCGTVCAASVQGSLCAGGMCVCPGTQTACSGACVDMDTDPKNCGTCGHDCLGGTCQAGMCQPVVLASGQANPTDIAVSSTSVYWINAGSSGAVKRVAIGGGLIVTVASSQASPQFLAIDATNVYWTIATGIQKTSLTGIVAPTTIATWSGSTATGLACDGTNVYWCSNANEIRRVSVGGGTQTLLSSAVIGPKALTVDGTSIYLVSDANIQKMSKAGGGLTTLFTTSTSTLSIYSGRIFFGWSPPGSNSRVSHTSTNGGSVTDLDEIFGGVNAIATDGTYVFWSGGASVLRRVPVTGGVGVSLAGGGVNKVAVDSKYVYWTNSVTGMVLRLAK